MEKKDLPVIDVLNLGSNSEITSQLNGGNSKFEQGYRAIAVFEQDEEVQQVQLLNG